MEHNGRKDYPQHTHRVPQLNDDRLRLSPRPLLLRGLGQPFLPTEFVFPLRVGVFFRGRATGDQASAANNSPSPSWGRAVQLLPCQKLHHCVGESPALGDKVLQYATLCVIQEVAISEPEIVIGVRFESPVQRTAGKRHLLQHR